jgi:hypothetical protein
MRRRTRSRACGAWVALLLCASWSRGAVAAEPPPAGYIAPDDLVARVEALVVASTTAQMHEVARTDEDRGLFVVAIGEEETPGRPGVLIVADPDGDRPIASQVALGLIEHLLSADARITQVASVYVVPVANPDGAAHAFAGENPWRGRAVDDDRDGRTDEDPAEDINDDGLVLQMRVPDPTGAWRRDETDQRAMVEADRAKGEAGGYRLLTEGVDNDADRVTNEDGIGGVRLEANWPHRWREHARDAGPFQLSEPESHGLIEFMLAHPNISTVIVLGSEDNTAEPTDGVADANPDSTEPLTDDASLLRLFGERLWDGVDEKPRGAEHGAGGFADWAYYQYGALVVESAVWSPPLDVPDPDDSEGDESDDEAAEADEDEGESPTPSDEAKLLAWNDATYAGDAFATWSPYEHPELGAVEIGGWLPLTRHNPTAEAIPALVARWAGLVASLADDLPRIEWVKVEVVEAADRLFDARATLMNGRLLPTMPVMGERTRRPLPIRVRLELPDGAELVAGRSVHTVGRLDGGGDSREFRWVYRLPRGLPDARLRAVSQAAGEAVTELEASR